MAAVLSESVVIFGSTGSVGLSTLDVVRRHPDKFTIKGLSAFSNHEKLFEQIVEFEPEKVVLIDESAARELEARLKRANIPVAVETGTGALDALVDSAVSCVVCAIVGAAGLSSTIASVKAGCKVLIANKEPLVMLGPAIMAMANAADAVILPLDSEHNAVFQCLPERWQRHLGQAGSVGEFGVRRILLTGSGGPFRKTDTSQFAAITPE